MKNEAMAKTVFSVQEKTQWESYQCVWIPLEAEYVKKIQWGSFLWHPVTRQEEMSANGNKGSSIWTSNSPFPREDDQALAQVPRMVMDAQNGDGLWR